MWTLNDAAGQMARKNCALVATAALVSHKLGKPVSSGRLISDLWFDVVNEVAFKDKKHREYDLFDKTEKTLQALDAAELADFNQNGMAMQRLMEARNAAMYKAGLHYRNLDELLRIHRGYRGVAPWCDTRDADFAGEIDGANQAEFDGACYAVRNRLNSQPEFCGQALSASAVVSRLAEVGPKALFVLHARDLGHWLFGYSVAAPADSPWAACGIELRFVDYQPATPKWDYLPFLGVAPTKGGAADENDLIVVRGGVCAQGLPKRQFDGEVLETFVQLMDAVQDGDDRSAGSSSARTSAATASARKASTSASTRASLDSAR